MFPAFIASRNHGVTLEAAAKLMTPGLLRGYNCHAVRGRNWHFLYPSENPEDQVIGIVYFDTRDRPAKFYKQKDATVEIL